MRDRLRMSADDAEREMRGLGVTPTTPFPGVSRPWPAIHDRCGRDFAPTLANLRRNGGGGCSDCAIDDRAKAKKAKYADAAVANLRELGWEPLGSYPGTAHPWAVRHERCGTESISSLNAIRTKDGRCAICWRTDSGHHVWTRNSAFDFMLSVGLTPLEPYSGSSTKPWMCRHEACGRSVSPRLGNLAAGQGPCEPCGYEAGSAKMRLEIATATSVMREAGLEPFGEYLGVDYPWECRHIPCGRTVSPTVTNIRRGQGGCNPCSYIETAAKLRMPEADAIALMREHDLNPVEPYPASMRPWRCRHSCGHIVSPTLSNVRVGKGICRYCNSNFPFDGAAQVYLVADRDALKVGMSAPGSKRIEEHVRRGWTRMWTLEVPSGDDAYTIEQAIISWWRDELGAAPHYTHKEMPQYGHSETVARDVMLPADALELAVTFAAEWGISALPHPSGMIDIRPIESASAEGRRARNRRPGIDHPTLF